MTESISLVRRFAAALGLWALAGFAVAQAPPDEEWQVHKDFERLRPITIAVLPMDNLSLEPGVEEALYKAVYERLASKGYAKISAEHVSTVMKRLGVTIPGLLAGFSPRRLGEELHADALLFGQIEQSARVNTIAYDAIVVSCSLRLVHVATGETLWQAQQWRTAHRQWQLDPVNALLNTMLHANASREDRVAYLVQEMLKTLPAGPVAIGDDNLLEKAKVIGK
jgi:hypothetical protein